MTGGKVAPHFYVPRPRVEESSTKKRRIVTAGDIPANSKGTQSRAITKTSDRRFFEAATVSDWGDQLASYAVRICTRTSSPSIESSLTHRLQAPDKEATIKFTVDMSESLHRKLSVLAVNIGRKKVD